MNSQLITDLSIVSPFLTIGLGSLLVMMLEVFLPPNWKRASVTFLVLFLSLLLLSRYTPLYGAGVVAFGGIILADPFSAFISMIIVVGSLLALLVGAQRLKEEGVESRGEFYALYLIATANAILLVMSGELITMFLALETMSMALYCLCGSAIGLRRSAESALKYFLLGSFSSAFLLYGIALLYGTAGSTFITDIAPVMSLDNRNVVLLGLGLFITGIFFKLGVVPFHFWTPDVYEGAPTSVTTYMATVIKVASIAVAMRVLWTIFGNVIIFWSSAVWYVAVLTMVVGNLIALRQRSIKRMLAYSSIAHAGYMLVGLLSTADKFGGGNAVLFYLIGYSVMSVGAFAVMHIVTTPHVHERLPDDISHFNGLGNSRPILAGLMTLFLLSLAGLPPGMVGLVGKVYLFSAAVSADYVGLAIIGVLCSAVSCYYYLNVIVRMYFVENVAGEKVAVTSNPVGASAGLVLAICAVAVVALGIFPSGVYDSAANVIMISQLLR